MTATDLKVSNEDKSSTAFRASNALEPSLISSPLIPEVGVLALVPDRWSWQWQPRHQVMTRLAKYFPVIWVNPAEGWRSSLGWRKLFTPREATPVAEKRFVVRIPSPFLPEFYSPRWLAQLTFRKRLKSARESLLRKGCKMVVLYLWRPDFAPALECLPHDLSCYHIDDEYSFSAVDKPIPEVELSLIKNVGQVFIHSPALLEKKGKLNPHTSFAPNGVDYDAHARPVPAPADIADQPRPRIGYSGYIKKQLDWPLLMELTARHPDWFFIFVGASNSHPEIVASIEELSRRKNVRFLGSKTAQELASYPQHFDVCIMPYRQDDYTKYIYPLKLHEYLAGGRPVVGTPIASLEAFRSVVRLPDSADQWSAAIEESLGERANAAEARAARQSIAKEHDWGTLVQKIAASIAERLGIPFTDRLAERMRGSQ